MTPYPKTFPSDAVSAIANSITKPTPATAEAAWNLAGYALGVTLGETQSSMPTAQPGMMMSGPPPSDEDAIQALTVFANQQADPKMMGSFPFTSQQILQWSLTVLEKVLLTMAQTPIN